MNAVADASARPVPALDLSWLLGPRLSVQDFLADVWEKRWLVLRYDEPRRYDPLLTLAELDVLIGSAVDASRDIRLLASDPEGLVLEQLPAPSGDHGRPNLPSLYEAFSNGRSINVNRLHRSWPPVVRLARACTEALDHEIGVNAYLSPPGTRGFLPHYDTHDVLVVQIAGSKQWRLYDTPLPFPLKEYKTSIRPERLGPPAEEFTVHAGDLLYVPRGLVHEAQATDDLSLHLTVGIHAATWSDLLGLLLQRAALSDPRLRQALPAPFLSKDPAELASELRRLIGEIEWGSHAEAAVGDLRRGTLQRSHTAPDGHFESLRRLNELAPDRVLQRRAALRCASWVEDGHAVILFDGNRVRGPAALGGALDFVASHERFRPRDLPDDLTDESKLVLCRRLITEGLLRFHEPRNGDADARA